MEIIIIEKSERWDYYVDNWKKHLQGRGHNVTTCTELSDLTEEDKDLSKYDVAIAHPDFEDSGKLYEEMKKREKFRVILHSADKNQYNREFLKSLQLIYSEFYKIDKLTKFVEKGW